MLKEIYFNDFIRLNRGFDLPNDQMKDGIYPVVASTSIKGYHNEYKIEAPCVVTGRSGSLGEVQYINTKCWPLNTSLYVKDFKGNNEKYVYYFLKTMHLEIYNSGAGVPTLNQNHLHRIKIKVHDIQTQKMIADNLSVYDDFIDNNNRQIILLERIAKELFKEWFVRMRFPNHQNSRFEKGLPTGWEVVRVKEIVKRLPFGTLYKAEDVSEAGKVIVIDQSRKDYLGFHNNEPSHQASNEKPIILFGDHTCKMQLMMTPFSVSENVIPFVSNKNISIVFLYYLINNLVSTKEYKRHWSELTSKKVLLPTKDLQIEFENKVLNNILLINMLQEKNRNLMKQRDLLLPRLLSGKIKL